MQSVIPALFVLVVTAQVFPIAPMAAVADPKQFLPPFFAFENGVRIADAKQQVKVLKELGYDGIGSAKPNNLPQRLAAYDAAGLKIFSLYVGGRLGAKGPEYDPSISSAIQQLNNRETMIELFVQGGENANDASAIAFVRDIADQAKASGLRVILYPHTGFYIETIGDAVRIAKACQRDNVGVMFNLCHFLKVERDADFRKALADAQPYLWRVSVSGANVGGNTWGELIQPLNHGDFDQAALLSELKHIGFDGAVGLQCYGVPGDAKANLANSIKAWNKNLTELN